MADEQLGLLDRAKRLKSQVYDAHRLGQAFDVKDAVDYSGGVDPIKTSAALALSQLPRYAEYILPAARALGPAAIGMGLGLGAYGVNQQLRDPQSPIRSAGRADKALLTQDWNAGDYGAAAMDAARAVGRTGYEIGKEMLMPAPASRFVRGFGMGGQ